MRRAKRIRRINSGNSLETTLLCKCNDSRRCCGCTYLHMPLCLKKSFRRHLASYHPHRVEPCVVFLSARNYQRINLVKSFTAHHQSVLWNRSHPFLSLVLLIVVILEFYGHDHVVFIILSLIGITWWSYP